MKNLQDLIQDKKHSHTAIAIDQFGKLDIQDNESMKIFPMWSATFRQKVKDGEITDIDTWDFNMIPSVKEERKLTKLN